MKTANTMKLEKSQGASAWAALHPHRLGLAAAIAASTLVASHAGAVTLIASDGFESYANNASLTSGANGAWTRDGNGTAVVTTTAGLAKDGTHAALLAPPNALSGSWVYKTNTFIDDPANSAEPIITSSVDLRITSAASGTANRTVALGLQTYAQSTTTSGVLATAELVWDPENKRGAGANHLLIAFGWYGANGDSFANDLGAVTAAQLAAVGYFNVSIALDYATGDIAFGWGNSALGIAYAIEGTHGSFDAASIRNFSDADLEYYRDSTTGGTLPRLLADNYLITAAAAVPESQTWLLMTGGLIGLTALRRRRGE